MEDVSLVALLGRLVVSLGVVLVLMALAARVLRRPGLVTGRTARPAALDVLARRGLSRHASIAIVRTGAKTLVVGVTDTSVRLLAEVEPGELEQEPDADRTSAPGGGPGHPAPSWKALVESLRERTVRRS